MMVRFQALLDAIPYALCEETTGYDEQRHDYIRCGAQATMVVLSERGRRLYFMCTACGTHNVDHRDVKLIATSDRVVALRYESAERR